MKSSTVWLVFINAFITMISSNSLASNDCLTAGEIKSVSAPYNVYFDHHETSSVIEYEVEFENSKHSTDIGNTVNTIEVYSEENNCRYKFKVRPCCESKLVAKYNYTQADWAYFDNSFGMDCQNKTLSLAIQNPRDLYITLRLMSNDSVIHSDTTHLSDIPANYYNSGQCIESYNQCPVPLLGGIESIEMFEGPGLYNNGHPNSYTLRVNTDKTAHDKYKYKIAYKIKTSRKLTFHGWVVIAWNPDLHTYDKLFWMDGESIAYRAFEYRNSDRHQFTLFMDNEKIIFNNFSKNFTQQELSLHIVRSNVPPISVNVIKDNQPQESCTRFLSDRQTHTKQKSSITQEQSLKTTTASPSEQVTGITTELFNTTESSDPRNGTGNANHYSSSCKIDHLLFSILGAGLILGALWHYSYIIAMSLMGRLGGTE